jgi:hypothetical protein
MFRSFRSWHYVLISVVVAINALVMVVRWVMTLR